MKVLLLKGKKVKYIFLVHFLAHFRLLKIRPYKYQMKISSFLNRNKNTHGIQPLGIDENGKMI